MDHQIMFLLPVIPEYILAARRRIKDTTMVAAREPVTEEMARQIMNDVGRLERLENDFRGQIDKFEAFKDALNLQLQKLAIAMEQAKSYGKFDKWAVGVMTMLIGGMATFIVDHWHEFQ